MGNDPEIYGKIILALYIAAGIPVAWLHIRHQKMHESFSQIKQPQASSLVIYTLAVLWPLLLFAMALNYLLEKPQAQRTNKSNPSSDLEPSTPAKPKA